MCMHGPHHHSHYAFAQVRALSHYAFAQVRALSACPRCWLCPFSACVPCFKVSRVKSSKTHYKTNHF